MATKATRRKAKAEESIELQLTPMIDVVFQLLVFFLCVTKFPDPEGLIKSWLPKDKGQDAATTIVTLDDARVILRMESGMVVGSYPDNASPDGFVAFEQVTVYDPIAMSDETVPDWRLVAQYLAHRRDSYREVGVGESRGLPVILDFAPDVPWRHVVELLNICSAQGLTNLQIAAQELTEDL